MSDQGKKWSSFVGAARRVAEVAKLGAEQGVGNARRVAGQGYDNARRLSEVAKSQAEQTVTTAKAQVEQSNVQETLRRASSFAKSHLDQGIGKVRSIVDNQSVSNVPSGADGSVSRAPESSSEALPPLEIRVCTWNLHGDQISPRDDVDSLLVPSGEGASRVAHLYVIGIQELVELGAKSAVLGAAGDEVRQQLLETRIEEALSKTSIRFTKVCSFGMVGQALAIYVREELATFLTELDCDRVKTGLDGQFGNKGCVGARFSLGGIPMCFVNVHLASGQQEKAERNQQLMQILSECFQGRSLRGSTRPAKQCFGRKSAFTIEDHKFCVIFGDFNSRLDTAKDAWPQGPPDAWLEHDQLLLGYYPSIQRFTEGMIGFPPTYKYQIGTEELSDKRIPAWCDRVLSKVSEDTEASLLEYDSFGKLCFTSDHRPVAAHFLVFQARDITFKDVRRSGDRATTSSPSAESLECKKTDPDLVAAKPSGADDQPVCESNAQASASSASAAALHEAAHVNAKSLREEAVLARAQDEQRLQAEQRLRNLEAQRDSSPAFKEYSAASEAEGSKDSMSEDMVSIHEKEIGLPSPVDSTDQTREQQSAPDELQIQPQTCDIAASASSAPCDGYNPVEGTATGSNAFVGTDGASPVVCSTSDLLSISTQPVDQNNVQVVLGPSSPDLGGLAPNLSDAVPVAPVNSEKDSSDT